MKKSYIFITMITLFALAQLPGFAQDWNIQTIDPSAEIAATDIKLDNNSNPHTVYKALNGSYYNLYYSSWNGIAWEIESINNTRAHHAQFCLDQNNNPHIIHQYSYSSYNYVRYSRRNASGNLQIKFDFNGYYDLISVYFRNGVLEFIGEAGGNLYQFIYNETNNSFASSIVGILENGWNFKSTLDNDGNVYFVGESSNNTIRFGFFDGTNVSSFLIAENGDYPSITLDNQDIPHVSFYKTDTDDLIHAKLPAQAVKYLKSLKDKNIQTATNIEE